MIVVIALVIVETIAVVLSIVPPVPLSQLLLPHSVV